MRRRQTRMDFCGERFGDVFGEHVYGDGVLRGGASDEDWRPFQLYDACGDGVEIFSSRDEIYVLRGELSYAFFFSWDFLGFQAGHLRSAR